METLSATYALPGTGVSVIVYTVAGAAAVIGGVIAKIRSRRNGGR